MRRCAHVKARVCILPFEQLSPRRLHEVFRLRAAVFVVEQACLYEDIDGLDPAAEHVLFEDDEGLAGYARILPAGTRFPEPSIGRVVVAPRVRGKGLGRRLMEAAIARAEAHGALALSAQAHLEAFYASLGFVAGERYDEDGIPHVAMRREAPDRRQSGSK